MAKYIIIIGIGIVLIGSILHFFPNAFKWFGNLPGDFKSTEGSVKFYFPLTSMILISVLINLIIRVYKFFI